MMARKILPSKFSIPLWKQLRPKCLTKKKSALEIWKAALDNITPQVEVKSRRVGGATFQVPTEIRPIVKIDFNEEPHHLRT